MMRHKPFFRLALAALLALGARAYAEVANIKLSQQANQVVVEYDLEVDKPATVSALMAIDGKILSQETLHFEGDIGADVPPGKGRRFAWNVLADYPRGVAGEVFVSVIAQPKKLAERDLVAVGPQQAEVFRRIDADRVDLAGANLRIAFDSGVREMVSKVEAAVKAQYFQEPDEALLAKSRYYCARFHSTSAPPGEIGALFEARKGSSPFIADASLDKYLNCLLGSLDPHSAYLAPEVYRELLIGTSGNFGGLGIEVGLSDGVLTVVSPIEDTPAARAGIRARDQIIEIDGRPTRGLTINESVKLMRGQPGTAVVLSVQREGQAGPLSLRLTRETIRVRSVRSRALEDGYAYVRISQFQERTPEDLGKTLDALRASASLKGLVLDLRNDPGGLLSAAHKVASRFIDDGLIVYTEGRTQESRIRLAALKESKEPGYPLVVLINQGSASASEIVAGALQDHRRALLVGTRSFGKGTVQTILPIQQSALRLTTALYYTPNGRSIQQVGIVPDVVLEQDPGLDEAAVALAQTLLREPAAMSDAAKRKALIERAKVEQFFALYKNAARATLAVSPATALAAQPLAPAAAVRPGAPPLIAISSPDVGRNLKVVAAASNLTVAGRASSAAGIAEVRVNGRGAALDRSGNFSAEVLLAPGENRIVVSALDAQGREATRSFAVNRQASARPAAQTAAPPGVGSGKYYALLIAVQDYASSEINRLEYPIADSTRLKDILVKQYRFDEENVVFLKNPDRKGIGHAFNELRMHLTDRDNLLIFYAGHGVWMDDMKEGYWLPRDASGANDPTDWIPNSTIRNYIRGLKARHVLLVADACFAGGIFRVRDAFASPQTSVEKIYEMPSRKAITSGSLKTVPDRSVFVEYLAKRLRENRERYLDAQKLFVSFKEAVINNSPNSQTPLYGAINEAGDEGGDFVFVKR